MRPISTWSFRHFLVTLRELGRELPYALGDELAELVFPDRCPLCGAPRSAVCGHALPEEPGAGPRCGTCWLGLADMLPDGSTCSACRGDPPPFERLVALGDYTAPRQDPGSGAGPVEISGAGEGEGVLREWILALKHGGRRCLAGPLGRAMARRLAPLLDEQDVAPLFVPVPLHPLRRLERGFDQAVLLAREVALGFGSTAPVGHVGRSRCVRVLERTKWTPKQGAPGSRSRRANVSGVFRVRRLFSRRALAEATSVWLVDDVATTGATLSACTEVLHSAGVRRVSVLVAARASRAAARSS